jgi:hypothetical protein
MSRRCAGLLVIAALSLASSRAFAGPVEQLDGVLFNAADPSHIIVPYRYGGGGMFISRDGGKSFGWLCSAGMGASAVNRNGRPFIAGDGSIYLGLFDGLMKGRADGCGFALQPEFTKQYVSDFASDPIDPTRTYLVTTTGMVENSVHVSEGGAAFTPLGPSVMKFLDTIDVVKNGDGRRFYVTAVTTDAAAGTVTYSVRVSDDDAVTWTDEPYDLAQFGPMNMFADFSIVAVDPTNPDHIVARVSRPQALDTLVFSTEKGKVGSWKLLAEPGELEGVTFTPEGVLYFGDSDPTTKGLFVVEKPGDAPKQLSDSWKVMCLGYDATNKRLLGCSNFYLFGEVNLKSGELEPLLDLRCAENIVECTGQEEMVKVCEPQAQQDFCNLSHWVLAPLCDAYDRGPELASYQMAQDIMCVDGFAVPKVEGAPASGAAGGGAAGAAGAAGAPTAPTTSGAMTMCSAADAAAGSCAPERMPDRAGTAAPSSAAGGSAAPKSSGGGCSALGGASSHADFAGLVACLGVLALSVRRARCVRRDHSLE